MSNPIAGPDDVAVVLGRDLTGGEEDRAVVLCDAVVAALELHLNRWLWERVVVGERRRTGQLGRLILSHYPALWIDALHYGSATAASVAFDPAADWEDPNTFPARTLLWVDYHAGDDFPNVAWAAAATDVVANAVGRVLAAPVQVATGVLNSYSVEGTSISYGGPTAQGSKGRLSVGDLGVLARLRVPVLL